MFFPNTSALGVDVKEFLDPNISSHRVDIKELPSPNSNSHIDEVSVKKQASNI